MRHRKRGPKLNRDSAHRNAMAANLAVALLEHGRIQTTETKAKLARQTAERAITLGKQGTLHARRQAIAPVFKDVPGGYTRVTKLGPRQGDAAPMVLLELSREVPAASTTPAA
jgi:large subunit ribosomal protein L17